MIPFDAKYQNTDEKGGKKVEKVENKYEDEEAEEQYGRQQQQFGFGGGRGGGFGGRRVVQCQNM